MSHMETPLPATLEEALEEIKSQRKLIIKANENWAKCAEMRERDARSYRGMLKTLREELTKLKCGSCSH